MNKISKFNPKQEKSDYLSDEALEALIAQIESQPLMQPPPDFQNEIFQKIKRKKEQRKERALFSYSMKIIAASAAALFIVLTVPGNIYSKETVLAQKEKELAQREKEFEELINGKQNEKDFTNQLNWQLNEHFKKLNEKLNQMVSMEVIYDEEEKE